MEEIWTPKCATLYTICCIGIEDDIATISVKGFTSGAFKTKCQGLIQQIQGIIETGQEMPFYAEYVFIGYDPFGNESDKLISLNVKN